VCPFLWGVGAGRVSCGVVVKRVHRGPGQTVVSVRLDAETLALVDAHVAAWNDGHPDVAPIGRADWLRWVIDERVRPARRPNRRRLRTG
jgi:hypothetical protein